MRIAVMLTSAILCANVTGAQTTLPATGLYLNQVPPGSTPRPFAPAIIGAEGAVHGSIAFSPDGTEIYWVLQTGAPGERATAMMVKLEEGVWQDPRPVEAIGPYGAGEIHVSPDGKRLYFASTRPWPEEWGRQPRPGAREAQKVWYLERVGSSWGSPQALPQAVNRDLGGVASTSGGTLYAPGIRRIRKLPSGDYGEVAWLGPPLDVMEPGGAFKGGHPYIAPDESFILFNDDWPGTVGYGVFVSFRHADGSWTPPVNVLERLGLPRGGSVPVLSPDQKFLFYFAAGQIGWVDAGILENLRAAMRRR